MKTLIPITLACLLLVAGCERESWHGWTEEEMAWLERCGEMTDSIRVLAELKCGPYPPCPDTVPDIGLCYCSLYTIDGDWHIGFQYEFSLPDTMYRMPPGRWIFPMHRMDTVGGSYFKFFWPDSLGQWPDSVFILSKTLSETPNEVEGSEVEGKP